MVYRSVKHSGPKTSSGQGRPRAFVAIRDNDLAAEVMGISFGVIKTPGILYRLFYAGWPDAAVHYYASPVSTVSLHGFRVVSGHAHCRWDGQHLRSYLWAVALKLLDELVTIVGPILSAAVLLRQQPVSLASSSAD